MPAESLIVNGEERPLAGCTVLELFAALGLEPAGRGQAVAVDGRVVPRGDWPVRPIPAGSRVEVVSAMQGGQGGRAAT